MDKYEDHSEWNNWGRYHTQNLLGAALAGQKKYAEAEPLLVSGYERMLLRKASIRLRDRPKLERAGARIVQFYMDWGKPEKAAECARSSNRERLLLRNRSHN